MSDTKQQASWHASTPEVVGQQLASDSSGLSSEEAARRLERYGPNRLAPPRRRGPLLRFALQFHNLLIYVMLAAALITAVLGHWLDTAVLLAAVLINGIIGFIQEGRAESALDSIRSLLSSRATVLRDGRRQELDAAELVPGDVVLLTSGDRVPADLRLFQVNDLRVDEAALTGESVPVDKSAETVGRDAPLGDRFGMAYSGTLVVYGQARGWVVATGATTELGRINRMLSGIDQLRTPLMRQVDHFARMLALAILGFCLVTFLFGTLMRGYAAADMFMMVVALAASAIPEGLPAILTVTLALCVQRMARRHAIVRHLPAVETLGSVTVICSDKTGTLTRNEMTVQRVICSDQVIEVDGSGYEPHGGFRMDGQTLEPAARPELVMALRAAVLCNDARLFQQQDSWQIEGDPTEGALLALGAKAGYEHQQLQQQWPRLGCIPFESQHRFMATWHRDPDGSPWIFVKGAPERILEMCDAQLAADGRQPLDPDYWRRMSNDLAARGLRLLAMAGRQGEPAGGQLGLADVQGGFAMLALVGIMDPPREEAIQAVADCQGAGIRVKMITGDHAETARAVGALLNIGVGKPAVTGAELALMDEAELRRVVGEVDVFARASPEQKLRLVQALQELGEVVAMTGDGVNDAPALKRADVGIAMGRKGTEVAREAADMVLTDDNFSTIARAVREGRGVYDNLRKFILFMLPTNGGESLVVLAAILFGLTLPMTPAQVLWINMVTAGALGLALAFEPAEPGIMRRLPRPPGQALLSPFFIWRVLFISVLMMAGALGLFLWELEQGVDVATARTVAVNMVVVAEMFYLFNSRHVLGPVLGREGLLGNPHVLLAVTACVLLQLLYTYLPALQTLFGSAALTGAQWLRILGAGLLIFVAAELEKAVMRGLRRSGCRAGQGA